MYSYSRMIRSIMYNRVQSFIKNLKRESKSITDYLKVSRSSTSFQFPFSLFPRRRRGKYLTFDVAAMISGSISLGGEVMESVNSFNTQDRSTSARWGGGEREGGERRFSVKRIRKFYCRNSVVARRAADEETGDQCTRTAFTRNVFGSK